MMTIFKQFQFDAAHQLGQNVAEGHKYGRVHGHSFQAELHFTGTPNQNTGWIRDFAEIDAAIAPVRAALDHQYLNDVDGLDQPTLETLARWIWDRIKADIPELSEVRVTRGSCGEGCVYRGA